MAPTRAHSGVDVNLTPEGRRVARIITRLNIGGPAIQALSLSDAMVDSGFQTILIHGRLGPSEGDMRHLMPAPRTPMMYINQLTRPVAPLRDAVALMRILLALWRWKPVIVHTHTAKAGALGRVAAVVYNCTTSRKRRARIVHTYHGHVFDGYFAASRVSAYVQVERWLAKRTDAVIAISNRIRRDLLDTYRITNSERIHVIPLGFDLARFLQISDAQRRRAREALTIDDSTFVVCTVGRLTAIKQHSLLLRAAACLHPRPNQYLFLIVGDGELRRGLEREATTLALDGVVRFLGWRGDVEAVYAASDLFLLTSRNEGTPVALIEAMASGLASISTDVGGVRDVIDQPGVGYLLQDVRAETIAAAVVELAADAGARKAMGNSARLAVREKFHKTRLVNDIEGLYAQLLADVNRHPQTGAP